MQEMLFWSLGGQGSSGEGRGNPLQYSCLENRMDRATRRATVHQVTELDTTEPLNTQDHFGFDYV